MKASPSQTNLQQNVHTSKKVKLNLFSIISKVYRPLLLELKITLIAKVKSYFGAKGLGKGITCG